MVKRLELEALKADLAAVEEVLSERSQAEDPSGWLQLGTCASQPEAYQGAWRDRAHRVYPH